MKTIICPSYLKNDFINQLLYKKNFITDTLIVPIEALYETANQSEYTIFLNAFKLLNSLKDELSVYKEMVKYPAFTQEMVDFAKDVILYDIDINTLKTNTAQRKELKIIISNLVNLPFNQHKIKNTVIPEDIEAVNYFVNSPFEYSLLKNHKLIPVNAIQNPSIKVKHALNKREEIEAIAQDLIKYNKVFRATIICTDINSQLPLINQVFKRYNIPIKNLNTKVLSSTVIKFLTYAKFALNKTEENLLDLVSIYKNINTSELNDYIKRYITDANQLIDNPMLGLQLNEDLPVLINSQDILKDSYNLLVKRMEAAEKNTINKIREIIESTYNLIEDNSHIETILYLISQIKETNKEIIEEGVTVTSLTKPVFNNDYVYVLGCTSKLYPGFKAKEGIFDEKYIENTGYPTLSSRHQLYFDNFKWIENSANKEIIYSYHRSDLNGKPVEGAYELEAFGLPKKWDLISIENHINTIHSLSEDTSKKLFIKNNKIYGSISSFENYYQCPYKYFISSGLKIKEEKKHEIRSDTIGNIVHKLMQQVVSSDNKSYYNINLEPFISSLKKDLLNEFPKQNIFINLLFNNIRENFLLNFKYFKEMEINNSFKPIQTEYIFSNYHITENVVINGLIDRIDTAYDLLRVIDYKSGQKELKFDLIAKGLSLQLITYLIVASHIFSKKPTQAFYFNFKNSLEKRALPRNEDYATFIKSKRLNGIIFNLEDLTKEEELYYKTGTNIKKLVSYQEIEEGIKSVYDNIYQNLLKGNIDTLPSSEGKPCEFCEYKSICRFNKDEIKLEKIFKIVEGKENEME